MKKLIILGTLLLLSSISSTLVFTEEAAREYETIDAYGTTDPILHYDSVEPVMFPVDYLYSKNEFRGVWIATVVNIDIEQYTTEQEYKDNYTTMLDYIAPYNLNAVIFQVRPSNDAFYDSELNPYSRYLMGEEGIDPGWDILTWLIDETHDHGMEFHAWFNPYRVSVGAVPTTKQAYLDSLDENNFARLNPDLVLQVENDSLILNPGEPAVKDFIVDTVMEVVENYDVDAIHFDDYFYPYGGLPSGQDTATYTTYRESGLQSIDDWRRSNVDEIVERISDELMDHNTANDDYVQFGVSPFGIWKTDCNDAEGLNVICWATQSYDVQYADTKKWVEEEWLDYIVPQAYWELASTVAPYADIIDWWADVVEGTDVNLYSGNAIYRYETNLNWYNIDELPNQLRYNNKYEQVQGAIYFSYKHFFDYSRTSLLHARTKLREEYYQNKTMTPPLRRYINTMDPLATLGITKGDENYTLSFGGVEDAKQYVVYRVPAGSTFDFDNAANIYDIIPASGDDLTVYFDDEITANAYDYYVSVVDKASNESTTLKVSTNDVDDEPLICGVGYELVEGECEEIVVPDPICEDNEELIEGECQPIIEPTDGMNTTLLIIGAVGGLAAIGAGFYFLKKGIV